MRALLFLVLLSPIFSFGQGSNSVWGIAFGSDPEFVKQLALEKHGCSLRSFTYEDEIILSSDSCTYGGYHSKITLKCLDQTYEHSGFYHMMITVNTNKGSNKKEIYKEFRRNLQYLWGEPEFDFDSVATWDLDKNRIILSNLKKTGVTILYENPYFTSEIRDKIYTEKTKDY